MSFSIFQLLSDPCFTDGDIEYLITAIRSIHPQLNDNSVEYSSDEEVDGDDVCAATDNPSKEVEEGDVEEDPKPLEFGWGTALPEVVLRKILKMLVEKEGPIPTLFRVGGVCRLWRKEAMSPSLWYKVDLSTRTLHKKQKTSQAFKWLCKDRFTGTKMLELDGWSKFVEVDDGIHYLKTYCKKLMHLNLRGWMNLNCGHLLQLTDNCPKLESIDLSNIVSAEYTGPTSYVRGDPLNQPVLILFEPVAEAFGNKLTHLSLAENFIPNLQETIEAIATHCRLLKFLDISSVITEDPWSFPFEIFHQNCNNLRTLRMAWSVLLFTVSEEAAEFQEAYWEFVGFPRLQELTAAARPKSSSGPYQVNIENVVYPSISSRAFDLMMTNAHSLLVLDITNMVTISWKSVLRIPSKKLSYLYIGGSAAVNGNVSQIIKKWVHNLIELDIAKCRYIEDAITELGKLGKRSPLRRLDVSDTAIKFTSVLSLLIRCPRLDYLNLVRCGSLPGQIRQRYSGREMIENLRSLVCGRRKENNS